jgi:hypothetical protein
VPILVGVSSEWRVKLEGVGFTKTKGPSSVAEHGPESNKAHPLGLYKM